MTAANSSSFIQDIDHLKSKLLEFSNAGESRCWIYGSSAPLSGRIGEISGVLDSFLSQWTTHGLTVTGKWLVLYTRFLVLITAPEDTSISGCSIDTMVNTVQGLETRLNLELLDSSRIFYRDGNGEVQVIDRLGFKGLAKNGLINPETPVFDPGISKLKMLWDGSFEKPLKESWHLKLYENALKA